MIDGIETDLTSNSRFLDRLEARGLVVRRSHSTDRRVKELVLTAAGAFVYWRVSYALDRRLNVGFRCANDG